MDKLSDHMKEELEKSLLPHWRMHGVVSSWLQQVRQMEREIANLRDRLMPRRPDTLPHNAGEGEV